MTLEKLQVIIEAQTKAYYEELKKMQQQTKSATNAVETQTEKIKSAFSKIGKVVGLALSVTAIISFGKSCIELGSNLAEVQNVVDVTFGAMSGTINKFARDALEEFGLSETSAKKYTSTMGAMLKSMGFTTQAAAEMSMEMTGLSADMASFHNLKSEEAFNKIRAGISGETEPLKDLGINMSVANLEAYALSQGITKAYNSMTQQEQTMLRYNYLLKATADAQGDFARTSDGWANQVRVLSERFNSLKAIIGQGLIAVLTPVVRVLNVLLSKILTVTDAFSNFVSKISGKNTKTTTTAVNNVAAATDSVGESAKSASKAMGGLLSMDEVHSLSKDSGASESGGSAGSSDLGESVVEAATQTDEALNPVLDALTTKLKELGTLFTTGFKAGFGDVDISGITKAVEGIKTSLKDIFTNVEVGDAANNFINAYVQAIGQYVGAMASVGTTIATNLLGAADKYLEENKGRISEFIVNMFDIGSEAATIAGKYAGALANIFSVFGEENGKQFTANIMSFFTQEGMGVLELGGKLGTDIYDLITRPFVDNQEGFKTIINNLLGVASESLGTLKQVVEDTFTKAKAVYDEHIGPMFESLATGFSNIVAVILEAYNTYIVPVLEGLQEKFATLVDGNIQPAINKGLELIGKVADAIKEIWEQTLQPLMVWIYANVVPIVAEAIKTVGEKIFAVAAVISDVIGHIFDALGGLIDFITGIFTGNWSKAWEGIKTFFSGIWEAHKALLSGAWDYIVSVVSSKIEAVKNTIQTVWNAVKDIFSTIWNGIKSVVSGVIDGIKTKITTVITTIKTTISNILTSIKTTWDNLWNGMKTTVSNVFTGIWNAIKGVINSILGGIEGMANGVINGINFLIGALNKINFNIPDWVPVLGGKSFGFNITPLSNVTIPKLAEGGIVDHATVAMIGEAGKEAVVPLENNTGWMDKVAARIGEIVAVNIQTLVEEMNDGEELQTIRTVVQLDSKTLVEQLDKFKRRKGYQMAKA